MFLAYSNYFGQVNDVLFSVIFLLRFNNLESKSVLVFKFACAILALKTSAAKVFNSGVVIYLS